MKIFNEAYPEDVIDPDGGDGCWPKGSSVLAKDTNNSGDTEEM